MAFDAFGRPLCSQCGCYMRMTVIVMEEKKFGGKVVEFNCTQCDDNTVTPLNVLLTMRINNRVSSDVSDV